MKSFRLLAFLTATALLAGCASSNSADVYSRGQARSMQTVQMGTVQAVRNIQIEGTRSGVGAVGGGVAGGVLGSSVGQGKGSLLATVGGAALGAVGGAVAEEQLTKKAGLEITVRLDSGGIIAVVQEADVMFYVGDHVRVLTSGGTARVVH